MSPMEFPSQQIAVVLKLGSALCGLAATVLLVLPLVRGEVGAQAFEFSPELPDMGKSLEGVLPGNASDDPVQESRTAFQGALLALESTPPGASVRVDGADQGETPVTVGLDCKPDKSVVVVFSLGGFASATHRIPCPRDALVTLKARLHRGPRDTAGKR